MAIASLREELADLGKTVVKLRDKDGLGWNEIRSTTGEAAGRCMLAYEFATVPASERINLEGKPLARKVVSLRDKDKISWGKMSALTNVTEARLRAIYTEETGQTTKGNRIGKGGRYPGDGNGQVAKKVTKKATGNTRAAKATTKKTAPVKKAVAKKAPAKKAAPVKKATKKAAGAKKASGGNSGGHLHPLSNLGFDELVDRLEGKGIVVAPLMKGGKDRTFRVKTVTGLDEAKGDVSFSTAEGSHTVRVANIRKVSK